VLCCQLALSGLSQFSTILGGRTGTRQVALPSIAPAVSRGPAATQAVPALLEVLGRTDARSLLLCVFNG
jgi:hypothetical protein